MCGLMGNADNNPKNDFQLPDKTITTNVATFANSWKINPKCKNGVVPANPCEKLSAAEYRKIIEKCGKLKEEPDTFQTANMTCAP